MTMQVIKAIKVLSSIATVRSQILSINCKNDMWTEITICRLGSVRMSQVWKCRLRLAWSSL